MRSSAAGDLALSEHQLEALTRARGRQPALRPRARRRVPRRRGHATSCPRRWRRCSRRGSTGSTRPTACSSATRPWSGRASTSTCSRRSCRRAGGPGDLERWERLSEFVERESPRRSVSATTSSGPWRTRACRSARRREIHGKVGVALEAAGRRRGAPLAALPRGRRVREGVAVLRRRPAAARSRNTRTSSPPSCTSARSPPPSSCPSCARDEVVAILESLGDVATLFAGYERAEEAFARALELAAGELIVCTRLMRKIGVTVERLGRREEGLEWFDRALGAARTRRRQCEGALENRVGLEIAYAGSLYYQSRVRRVHRVGGARCSGTPSRPASTPRSRTPATSSASPRPRPGGRSRATSSARSRSTSARGELVGHGILLNNLGLEAFEAYRWDEAVERLRRAAELSERAGDVTSVARVHVNEADVLAERGTARGGRAAAPRRAPRVARRELHAGDRDHGEQPRPRPGAGRARGGSARAAHRGEGDLHGARQPRLGRRGDGANR